MPGIVYASSSSVYGLNTKVPSSEEDRVDNPASLYAATKKANEMIAHCYKHIYGLSVIGLRFFTVYGPWGRPDMAAFHFTKKIEQGEPIKIFQGPGGSELERDFTYIDDIVTGGVGQEGRQELHAHASNGRCAQDQRRRNAGSQGAGLCTHHATQGGHPKVHRLVHDVL